jgi:hypothetical protein
VLEQELTDIRSSSLSFESDAGVCLPLKRLNWTLKLFCYYLAERDGILFTFVPENPEGDGTGGSLSLGIFKTIA